MELQLDDFNDRLLAEHTGAGARTSRVPTQAGWIGLAAIFAMAGYWAWQSGAVQSSWQTAATTVRNILGAEKAAVDLHSPIKSIRARKEAEDVAAARTARENALARIDAIEAKAVRGQQQTAILPDELERLRVAVEKSAVAPKPEPQKRVPVLEKTEKAHPMVVARAAPAARPNPVTPRKEEKLVEARAKVVDVVREEEQSGLMLFRKRDTAAAPVLDRVVAANQAVPVAAQPVRAPSPSPTVVTDRASSVVDAPSVSVPPGIRPPVLVVEETGVRIVGPEGERFIPIGGKLNGKHILATSPKIGLIVTEDSAIRVNTQEK